MSETNPGPKPANGATPGSPSGSSAGAPGDPQMDDILASIRRILNEDEAAGAAPGLPPPPPAAPFTPAAPPAAEPLELTESMLVQPPQMPLPGPPPAPPPLVPLAAAPPPAPQPAPQGPPPMAPQVAPQPAETLVAPAVVEATTAAVGQLLRTVAQERAALVSRGGPSIEDVVREEIRPILKEWLDRNLPPLVERLVRTEIERLVGRAMP